MKKLKLSELDLGDAEVLSKEQLKQVLGGMGSGGNGSGAWCSFYIKCVGEDGIHQTGYCSGPSDPVYGCTPFEIDCFDNANERCNNRPGCSHCVTY